MRTARVTAAFGTLAVTLLAAACGSNTTPDDPASPTQGSVRATTTTTPRPTGTVDELVAISDGRLHLRCSGSGEVTVLLLAGWDHGSADWVGIQPEVAKHARVCAYDRFGTGTSDPAVRAHTFESQVADLHELLDETDEPGPYVVVGHSFGGSEAVTYASKYPEDVRGLMLVDSSPTTWPETVCSVPAYADGCALMRNPTQGERLDVIPAFEAVAEITSLGDLPMTVMTAAERVAAGLTPAELARLTAVWREGTERSATLSSASRIVTVDDTGHAIQDDQPRIVIQEIVRLVDHATAARPG